MAGHCFPGFELHFQKSPIPNYRNGLLSGMVHVPPVPILGRLRQEDTKFQARLECIVRFYLKVRHRGSSDSRGGSCSKNATENLRLWKSHSLGFITVQASGSPGSPLMHVRVKDPVTSSH